jgi:hypothetical protein
MGFGGNGAVVGLWSIPFFCFLLLFNFVSCGEKKMGESYPPDPLYLCSKQNLFTNNNPGSSPAARRRSKVPATKNEKSKK